MAELASEQLAEVFREVDKFLVILSTMKEARSAESDQNEARTLTATVAQMAEHGAILAFRQDPSGRIVQASGGSGKPLQKLLGQVPPCGSRYDMCVSGPFTSSLAAGGKVVVCTMETGQGQSSAPTSKDEDLSGGISQSVGRLGMLLDWGDLQRHITQVTRISKETYSWILDEHGRLIMHPEHMEKLGTMALEPQNKCVSCHADFDLHDRMTSGEAGMAHLQVKGREEKMVVYTPVKVGDKRWSLALAMPMRITTMTSQRDLLSIFLFTGAIILVMLAGALMLDREASRRLRIVDRFNRQLETKVSERTVELSELYERLAALQANHTRLERTAVAGEMAAIVAHEVRQPLNALSINTQRAARLLRREEEGASATAMAVLESNEGEIQRINELLEDHLLALVRGQADRSAPLQVKSLVQDCAKFMEPQAARQGVQIVLRGEEELPLVRADEAKLRQVLLNIILNAIQAMPDQGKVTIETSMDGDMVKVRISDNGPGIKVDGDDINQVFRPFHTSKEDGTGLGLAICARLIKDMKGEISATSIPGEGATFEVSLPALPKEGEH